MKKTLTTIILLLASYFLQAQIIINEVSSDAGNFEGTADWIELKNIGATAQDLSCWRLSNGGSFQLSIPQGLSIDANGYLLIGNVSKMMCPTCDYKLLNSQFSFNPNGYGLGSGNYAGTVLLNTDIGANGGCDCLTGTGSL
ncbi:MAG TPA: lamin tail domain-containing protein, partial [Chitinophagaceae bacterium]|nr:lamin tail domain-containing protein [Chitinophagaceae bacterium]